MMTIIASNQNNEKISASTLDFIKKLNQLREKLKEENNPKIDEIEFKRLQERKNNLRKTRK